MDPTYQSALDGTLKSQPTGSPLTGLNIYNQLPCAIQVFFVETNGLHTYLGVVNPAQNAPLSGACAGDYYVATTLVSGAFICPIGILAGTTAYCVNNQMLTDPNDIGPIPQPTTSVYVPQNSPSVLVGCGTIPPTSPGQAIPASANYVTREQYWALQGDSYSLAVGEARTISFTVTTGKQQTSSAQADISSSVGVSGSAGWGPVSASLSASLNMSASVFQQVTISEQTSSYVSDVVRNDGPSAQLVLRWQMVDMMGVFSPSNLALATVSTGSVVIVQPYDLSGLGAPQARMAAVRRAVRPALGASIATGRTEQ